MDSNPRAKSGCLGRVDSKAQNVNRTKIGAVKSGERKKLTENVCTTCKRQFGRAYNLKVHMRKHSGEMPYECPMDNCVRKFKWRSSMAHHVRAHHNGSNTDILRSTIQKRNNDGAAARLKPEAGGERTPGGENSLQAGDSTTPVQESSSGGPCGKSKRGSNHGGEKQTNRKKRPNDLIHVAAENQRVDLTKGSSGEPATTAPERRGKKRFKNSAARSPLSKSRDIGCSSFVNMSKASDLDELFERCGKGLNVGASPNVRLGGRPHRRDASPETIMPGEGEYPFMNASEDNRFHTTEPLQFDELNEQLEGLYSLQARDPFMSGGDRCPGVNERRLVPETNGCGKDNSVKITCSVPIDAPIQEVGSTSGGMRVRAQTNVQIPGKDICQAHSVSTGVNVHGVGGAFWGIGVQALSNAHIISGRMGHAQCIPSSVPVDEVESASEGIEAQAQTDAQTPSRGIRQSKVYMAEPRVKGMDSFHGDGTDKEAESRGFGGEAVGDEQWVAAMLRTDDEDGTSAQTSSNGSSSGGESRGNDTAISVPNCDIKCEDDISKSLDHVMRLMVNGSDNTTDADLGLFEHSDGIMSSHRSDLSSPPLVVDHGFQAPIEFFDLL